MTDPPLTEAERAFRSMTRAERDEWMRETSLRWLESQAGQAAKARYDDPRSWRERKGARVWAL